MDNIENNNVIQEQVEQQNDEIQFNYPNLSVSKPLLELKKGDTVFVVDGYNISVGGIKLYACYRAVTACADTCSLFAGDIYSRMQAHISVGGGVLKLAVAVLFQNLTLNRHCKHYRLCFCLGGGFAL